MLGANNFKSRKNLNKYEEVRNQQRKDFFLYRDMVLGTKNPLSLITQCFNIFIEEDLPTYDLEYLKKQFNLFDFEKTQDEKHKDFKKEFIKIFEDKVKSNEFDEDYLRELMLKSLDYIWKKNINEVESIQYGSNLMAYAQKDPFHEFNIQASNTFKNSITNYRLSLLVDFINKKEEIEDSEETIGHFDNIIKNLKNNFDIENQENDINRRIQEILEKLQNMNDDLEDNLEVDEDHQLEISKENNKEVEISKEEDNNK
jgi:preprotein translocase subunit SecA